MTTINRRFDLQFLINRIALLIVFCLFAFPTVFQAQENLINIKGKVTDTQNEPLIGATVVSLNSKKSGITNASGVYELKGVAENDILLISYIGMKKKSIPVNGKKQIDVVLEEDFQMLDEVVAIGYGTMKKSDLTGSVKNVGGSSFSEQAIQTAEQALKGRVAGVKVTSDNSPGGGVSIQIRGTNSMLGGTEPLFVVDGFPMETSSDAKGAGNTAPQQSSLNFINPDDIESIEVLKDASASAIYGARGANGVVLITTKSGKSGKTQITYNGKFSVSQLSKKIDVLNEEEFANYINQKEINRYYIQSQAVELGILSSANLKAIELPYNGVNNPYPWDLKGTGTDWQDAIYQNAFSTNHSLTIQGGNNDTKMSLTGGYTKQDGVIINTNFQRFTLSGSIDHKINNNLTLKNRINTSRIESSGGNVSTNDVFANRGVVSNALWFQPLYKLTTDPADDEDYMNLNEGMEINNPYLLAMLYIDDKLLYSVQDIVTAEYKINKNLTATGTVALSKITNSRSQYFPIASKRGFASQGDASISTNDRFKYMTEARLNYQKTFKKNHTFSSMGAVSFEDISFQSYYQRYTGFPSDDLTYYNLPSATTIYAPLTEFSNSRMLSYIYRGNYKFKDRYLLTVTFRADGTSRGAKNVKFGYFPSIAGAWRLTDEPFMPKSDWLNNFKLRASYGSTGNQPYVPYQSISKLGTIKYPFDNSLTAGVYEQNIGNQDLSWEITNQYNVGFDASLFDSKINLSVDLYTKKTENLLQMVKLPASSGFTERLMNLGDIENKGIEFELNAPLIAKRKVSWNVNVNGGLNRNKLLSLGDRDYIAGNALGGVVVNRFMVGQPLGVFYGLKQVGVFKDWDQVLNSPEGVAQRDATPGEYIFENISVDYDKDANGQFLLDASGNKIPAAKQIINNEDYTVIGDPNPDFVFGFGTDFRYKKFDFSILFSGQIGGDIYWVDYGIMTNMWRSYNMYAPSVANAWVAPYEHTITDTNGAIYTFGNKTGNTNGVYPRALNWDKESSTVYSGASTRTNRYRNDQMNSSMILDATNLKIQNISIGYTFNKILGIQDIRLSLTGTNLLTISNYPGYDPETASSNSPMMRGVDLGAYPAQRNYSFNVQVKF